MKRTLAIILSILMVLTLFAGCGEAAPMESAANNSAADTPAAPAEPAEAAEGEAEPAADAGDLGLIGFCSVSMSESIYVLEQQALEEIFAGKCEIQTVSCDNDAATQIQQIKNFVTMGADMIIINPTDIEALGDAIIEAHEAGVKVYINGATSDSLSEEYYDCASVSDEYLCGAYVALIAKNWIENHLDILDATGDWEVAFLESSLSEETLKRTYGMESIIDPYLKDWEGNYVDESGNIVDEAGRVDNPAYSQVVADHYAGVKVEQDQGNGGLNVANVLTTNPNTRVFIAYNSLASTQGGQYIVDNYPDELESFAFFSAGVMGNEADYMVSAVSGLDAGIGSPTVMRGACQFGVSAAGGEVADSVANTAYAIMYGVEGVDYFKKNPDGIAAWWTVDEAWGDGTAYVAHFNILSGATVQPFDPIATLTAADTTLYWNSVDGYVEAAAEETDAASGEASGEPAADTPALSGVTVPAGEYSYMEPTPFGEFLWTVTLNEDGTAVVAQPENVDMGAPTWTAVWTDNGDGTVLTAECEGEGPQIAGFWENNSILWRILNDNQTVPVKADDYGDKVAQYGLFTDGAEAAPAGEPVQSGKYTFAEETPFGEIGWTVTLNEDGSFVISQPDNVDMGVPTWTGTQWVDNGDGTFTTPDCEGDGPQIASFWKNNGITWKDNGDGTVTAIG